MGATGEKCKATTPEGEVCGQPATIPHPLFGMLLCEEHALEALQAYPYYDLLLDRIEEGHGDPDVLEEYLTWLFKEKDELSERIAGEMRKSLAEGFFSTVLARDPALFAEAAREAVAAAEATLRGELGKLPKATVERLRRAYPELADAIDGLGPGT